MERGARNSDGSVVVIEAVAADLEGVRERTRVVCSRLNRTHADLVAIAVDLFERELWAEGGTGLGALVDGARRHVPATHSSAATDLARQCTVPQLRRVLFPVRVPGR